jgi:hypothetical protein
MINRSIELRKEEKRKNFGQDALLAILILRSRIEEKDRIKELDREIELRVYRNPETKRRLRQKGL